MAALRKRKGVVKTSGVCPVRGRSGAGAGGPPPTAAEGAAQPVAAAFAVPFAPAVERQPDAYLGAAEDGAAEAHVAAGGFGQPAHDVQA